MLLGFVWSLVYYRSPWLLGLSFLNLIFDRWNQDKIFFNKSYGYHTYDKKKEVKRIWKSNELKNNLSDAFKIAHPTIFLVNKIAKKYRYNDNYNISADLDFILKRTSQFDNENRAGIEQTLHRICCIRNRQSLVNGLTYRIGRAIFGTIWDNNI